jgi:Carboxypeptidase regulatory-like domain
VAAHEMDEGTTNLDLQLQPGLVVTGRIQDVEGKPLSNGLVRLTIWSGNNGWQWGEPIKADAQGRFEIIALAPDQHYSFSGSAKGYGSGNQDLPAGDLETNRVELEPFVLPIADRRLAGQVLDADEKPVVGAWVYMYGQGQPNGSIRSDNQGRFAFDQVCEGQIQVSASAQSSYGSARAEAGDTNVLIRLGLNEPFGREAPARVSLTGKPLPDLTTVNLSADAVPTGKPVLLCLFDIEQRPSRRIARLLNEQQGALQQKGIVVLGVQAAVTTDEAFKEWKDTSPVSFPVGRLTGKTDKTKWVSEVESLPWLILTDADHRVTAEGFALDELEPKLEDLAH